MTPIFESHAHYDDDAFDEDRDILLGTMQENRIGTIINVGASLASTEKTVQLMNAYPFIYGAIGIHPNETGELNEGHMQWLKELCMLDKTVAVGEIGLDYYWDEPEHSVQKKWFRRQLELAKETKLPIIVHSRDAGKDTLDILKEHLYDGLSGVIHCFSYPKEIAREYLKLGYLFGIGGVVTFPNAKKLKEAVAYIPIEHILLETDCPYLAPVPYRGKRNSSLHLPYIAKEIAAIKGMDTEEVIDITTKNAKNLFQKAR